MKKTLLLISFLISFNLSAQAQVVDKIIAVVDNSIITQSDLDEEKKKTLAILKKIKDPAQKKKIQKKIKAGLLDQLINEKIFAAEMDQANITVGDTELKQAIDNMLLQRRSNRADLKRELKKQGISFEEFEKNMRQNLRKTQFLQKTIYPQIVIGEYDLRDYYQKHAKDYLAYKKIRFLEILLTPASAPPGKDFYEFVEQIARSLRKGTAFKSLAKKFSKGAFAQNGGDSGLVPTQDMRQDLLEALYSQNIGVLAGPMSLEGSGVLFFKVLQKKSAYPQPFNAVKEKIRSKLLDLKVEDQLQAYLVEARSRHFVEIRN